MLNYARTDLILYSVAGSVLVIGRCHPVGPSGGPRARGGAVVCFPLPGFAFEPSTADDPKCSQPFSVLTKLDFLSFQSCDND